MSMFWLLAIAMSALALVFILPPLLSNKHRFTPDRDRLNTAVIREQLAELDSDLQLGKLGQDAYAAARGDLERELLDSVDTGGDGNAGTTQSGRWAIALLAPMIPLLAVFIYQQLGAGPLLDQMASGQGVAQGGNTQPSDHAMQEMIGKLAERMREQPDNLEGWLLLARSYASVSRFDDALAALGQARRLAGDEPDLLIDTADMMIAANRGEFTDEVGQLLTTALEKQPGDLKGLWLMGHWHYRRGNLQQAIQNWQQVEQQLPPGDPDAQAIGDQIRHAKRQLGDSPEMVVADSAPAQAAQSAAPAGTAGAGLQVKVSLDPALAGQAAPTDTVFIFARAAQGPRMPLAIVRKQVRDLPVSVTLDDSMAMTPAMVLSNFELVAVGARVSKSGQANPAPGDLEAIAEGVRSNSTEPVELNISTVLN